MNATLPTTGKNEASASGSPCLRGEDVFSGVRLLNVLVDADVGDLLNDYARVHRMSASELARELIYEKLCPYRSTLAAT